MSDKALIADLAAYLGSKLPGGQDIKIEEFSRIYGGASRETYSFIANWTDGSGEKSRPMILRRDPSKGLIDTDRDIEFAAYRVFHGTGIPVPEPLFLETDTEWLGRPFFVMEKIEGGETGSPFAADTYGDHANTLGEQFWSYLGSISANAESVKLLGAHMATPNPEDCWRKELDHWEAEIDANEQEPQPLARSAIRWLRRNPPPPPAKISVVHGDYRTGNFLHNGEGKIIALLDWEMVHLGDFHEDVAWAIDPLWCWFKKGYPGLMTPQDEALACYEQSSGLKIDLAALHWWEIFSHIKGLAIWITAATTYTESDNKDLVLAFTGLVCADIHNQVLAEKLPALWGLVDTEAQP